LLTNSPGPPEPSNPSTPLHPSPTAGGTCDCQLTKSADIAGAVDGALQCGGDGVRVGDDGYVGGLIVELGATSHRPRRVKLAEDAACLDAERRFTALRVGIVELDQVETAARVEHVLAQQKLRPGPNFASIYKRNKNNHA